ncbi:hypothetical protein A1O3_02943 [Capronia epimyces CBS 606.96]|uniref:Major facilitator superfamily (MFS) profile domain-containing protein n=1 Tax=Capronia epimyces CBS 606.96 TaxID=1182542 RepID=W9YKY3_9EURO|nr:uncharacterized protein A1O3_02943 [Capronia epimyces CBS 606.96]EXJ89876.1 hypothetical protein A1O3_02943 [Capronia epimyces CBS 606.96]
MASETATTTATDKPGQHHEIDLPIQEDLFLEDPKHVESEDLDDDPVFTKEQQRKIKHRIDRRLITMTGFMYMIAILDRSNLGNAAIAGMTVDLHLNVGYRYSLVALVLFITYVVFQPPATLLTRKLGPRFLLPALCLCWGIIMICFGLPHDWVVLIPLRLLLGAFEAGYFPGCVYLISTYYSRYDLHKRYGVFYIIGIVSSAFSGIFAYGITQMVGLLLFHLSLWRWMFIIEGLLTCIIAGIGFIYLVPFPDQLVGKTKFWPPFLKQDEIEFVLRRINKDRNDAELEQWNFKKWIASGLDPKVWSFALIFAFAVAQGYAVSYFLPIILRETLGFSLVKAQCLTAPPYAFAAIVTYAVAWFGDRYHVRGPLLAANAIMGLVGLPILGWASSAAARYFGTFLVAASGNAATPAVLTYQANNIRGHWKRAFCSATLVGFGGIGGIIGSLIFRSQDAPEYRPGLYGCMGCNACVIILVVINSIYFRLENSKADRGRKILEGDANFRYTI